MHFSALIRSGQITREEALESIKNLPYNKETIEQDKEYVYKKLDLSEQQYEEIMKQPLKSFKDYKTYDNYKKRLNPIIDYFKRNNMWPTIA